MDDTTQARLHRFRPTPGRCLLALLVVEFLLFLSQWFRWLPKGWPVLIAVASVVVVVLGMFVWFGLAVVFRRRFQFSLRSLLVLVVIVAIPCSWLAVEMKKSREQREVVQAVVTARGFVFYDFERFISPPSIPRCPAWLQQPLGEEFFSDITVVNLMDQQIPDAGLEHLKRLTKLEFLDLGDSSVSDAGLECLEGLTTLEYLYLAQTQASDAGMEHLKGLSELRELNLSQTKVSNAGLKSLGCLTKLEWLNLEKTQVGDAGLEHLAAMAQLEHLHLQGTNVTDAGVAKLQQALPNCKIHR